MSSTSSEKTLIVDVDGDVAKVDGNGALLVDIGAASISAQLTVDLDHTDDSVQLWGNEHVGGAGTARAILTDAGGRLQVDVLTAPTTAITIGAAVEVIQDTPADLTATVTQASSARSITGTVEVVQDTPADLTATVTQASTSRTISGTVEVVQDTPADLTATVTQQSAARTVTCDTAANLLATVTQSSAARTVTGTVGHNITGMVSEINDDVDASPEDLRVAGDTACKRVDMMADPDNTGYIWVGDASVANDGTGGGIRLGAGDFYSIDTDMVNNIHVAATVANQKIMYTYYT